MGFFSSILSIPEKKLKIEPLPSETFLVFSIDDRIFQLHFIPAGAGFHPTGAGPHNRRSASIFVDLLRSIRL
jgi:hypothetical protein